MPIYEFVCLGCKHEFEELSRSMTDPQEVRCPKCGGRVDRKLSLFAARKGTSGESAWSAGCGRCGDPNGPCSS